MSNLRLILVCIIIMMCNLIIAGCITQAPPKDLSLNIAANNTTTALSIPASVSESSSVQTNESPVSSPQFVIEPARIPDAYRFSQPIGFFDDIDLMDWYCRNENVTFKTYFTYISGSDGPHRIRYELVPVEDTTKIEEPYKKVYEDLKTPTSAITNISIEPHDFIAENDTAYISRVNVSLCADATGKWITVGDLTFGRGVGFTLELIPSVDGNITPALKNRFGISRACLFTPAGYRSPLERREAPDISMGDPKVTLGAGQKRFVNFTIHNANGWIRQYAIKVAGVPVTKKGLHSSSGTAKPIPTGMEFGILNPDLVTEKFGDYVNGVKITVNTSTPSGNYTFPLEICYQNLDLMDNKSPDFPYAQEIKCIGEPDLFIHVN
jgi:hypothetical protein